MFEVTYPRPALQEQFEAFHAANPAVYVRLVSLARATVRRGQSKVGIAMLWEVLRWQETMRVEKDADGFRLNNNLKASYARLIMQREPDLVGVFHVRSLKEDACVVDQSA